VTILSRYEFERGELHYDSLIVEFPGITPSQMAHKLAERLQLVAVNVNNKFRGITGLNIYRTTDACRHDSSVAHDETLRRVYCRSERESLAGRIGRDETKRSRRYHGDVERISRSNHRNRTAVAGLHGERPAGSFSKHRRPKCARKSLVRFACPPRDMASSRRRQER
jgi:hypothetical protein